MCHDGCGVSRNKNENSKNACLCPETEDGRALEKCDNLCNDPKLWVKVKNCPLKD